MDQAWRDLLIERNALSDANARYARIHQTVRRDAAVVTAVHVARDWAIQQNGDRTYTPSQVRLYMRGWFARNEVLTSDSLWEVIEDLVEAVWALAELPNQDPLTLVDDDYHGTSDEARQMLTAQYERDLQHALSRITWKA